jgi:hypothetical protein
LKIVFLNLIVFTLFLFSSFTKNGALFINSNSINSIPSIFGLLNPFSINTPKISSCTESELSMNKTPKKWIFSINPSELEQLITALNRETFSFLNSFENHRSDLGLSDNKIACLNSIPSSAENILSGNTLDDDLNEYTKKDSFKRRTIFVTHKTIALDINIDVKPSFLV